ncbi:MAG: hypothetical protein ACU0CI_05365 [Shimia sp.]
MDGYSRLVGWLKIVLPLTALALLSTLFMFSGQVDPTQSLPYSELNVEEIAREQRLSDPEFAGVTSDGDAITIGAAIARPVPDRPDVVEVERIEAALEGSAGTIRVSAPLGRLDSPGGTARAEGGARLVASDGSTFETEALTASLTQTRIVTDGAVQARTPFGALDAGQLTVDGASGATRLIFNNGVRVIYTPPQ